MSRAGGSYLKNKATGELELVSQTQPQPDDSEIEQVPGRLQVIIDAIPQVPTDGWTEDDKPTVSALESLTGLNISAAERDEAFDLYKSRT